MPVVNGGQPLSSSPTTSSVAAETTAERPQSVASIASLAARNWFSFGRASSQSTPATELLPPLPTPSPIAASVETFGGDSLAGKRDSPHAVLNASHRPENTSPVLAVNGTSVQSGQQREHNLPPLPTTSKGKEKARTLDLGISIPDAEGIEDTRGVTSAFSSPPGSADTAAPVRLPDLGSETTRGTYAYNLSASARSPRPPVLPAVPSNGAVETTSLLDSGDAATTAGPDATRMDGALAAPTRRPRRPEGQAAPRPHAMHYERTPPGLHADFFPATVGGPSASEMTAGAKSPKSPNELRWAKVSGTLPSSVATSSTASTTNQQYSSSQRSQGGKEPRIRAATTDLRSSPALPCNEFSTGRPPRAEEPLHRRPSAPASPIPPHSSPLQQHRPTLLPVDTTSSTLAPPLPDSGSHRRPHSAGVGAARPGFPRTIDGSAPYSTAQAALSSGPASANPAGSMSTFTGPTPNRSPLLSQAPWTNGSFSSSSSSSAATAYPLQQRGMTPSTSLSSLPSNSSLSSSVGAPSSSGHSTLSGAGGGSRHGLAGSPDDTKAAQDLENLMQNILEMSEGLFGQDGVDGVDAVAAAGSEGKPVAADASGLPSRRAADSQ